MFRLDHGKAEKLLPGLPVGIVVYKGGSKNKANVFSNAGKAFSREVWIKNSSTVFVYSPDFKKVLKTSLDKCRILATKWKPLKEKELRCTGVLIPNAPDKIAHAILRCLVNNSDVMIKSLHNTLNAYFFKQAWNPLVLANVAFGGSDHHAFFMKQHHVQPNTRWVLNACFLQNPIEERLVSKYRGERSRVSKRWHDMTLNNSVVLLFSTVLQFDEYNKNFGSALVSTHVYHEKLVKFVFGSAFELKKAVELAQKDYLIDTFEWKARIDTELLNQHGFNTFLRSPGVLVFGGYVFARAYRTLSQFFVGATSKRLLTVASGWETKISKTKKSAEHVVSNEQRRAKRRRLSSTVRHNFKLPKCVELALNPTLLPPGQYAKHEDRARAANTIREIEDIVGRGVVQPSENEIDSNWKDAPKESRNDLKASLKANSAKRYSYRCKPGPLCPFGGDHLSCCADLHGTVAKTNTISGVAMSATQAKLDIENKQQAKRAIIYED